MSSKQKICVYFQNEKALIWNANDASTLREEWRIVGCLVGCLPRLPRQNNHLGLPLQLTFEEVTLLLEKGVIKLVKGDNPLPIPTDEEVQAFENMREKSYQNQVELFKDERKKEIQQNMPNIVEGKRKKMRKDIEAQKSKGEEVDESELEKDLTVDLDSIVIPPIDRKHSLVQLFTESPYKTSERQEMVDWQYPQTVLEKTRYLVFRDLWQQGYFLTKGSKFGGDFLVYPGDPARFHSHYIAICMPGDKKMTALDIVSLGRLGSNVRKTALLCSVNGSDEVMYTSLQWTGIS